MFFTQKTRFVSIMVTILFLMFLNRFLKLTARKGQNGHFWAIKKCPKIGGLIPSFILAFGGFERNIFGSFILET